MRYLKTNTATTITVGPFYDKTDGITPETALTATNEKLTLIVDNAGTPTLALDANATASGGNNDFVHVTNDDGGYYTLELTAANTNYLGGALLSITYATDHCPVFHEFTILPAMVYDSMIAGTDVLQSDVTQWLGTAAATPTVAGVPEVDVTHWLGTAAATPTTAGVPEVDLTYIAGAAVSTTTAQLGVNVVQLSGDGTAADNAEAFFDGTGYAGTNNVIPTVTDVTTKTGYRLSSTGVDDIWDEAMSGHVTAGSAGAALYVIRSGTAQAGASTTITLDASASAVPDFYKDQIIYIVSGTGAGQGRIISGYNENTKVATVSSWATNPSSDSVFVIMPFGSIPGASAPTAAEVADAVWDEARADHLAEGSFGEMLQSLHQGTAQAGASSSITLDATGASSTPDFYKYAVVEIVSGTGAKQSRQITAYNGMTKVATVDPAWTTAPSTDSNYVIKGLGIDAATIAQIADGVWDEARAGHVTAGTFGEYVLADMLRVSGSSAASDTLESVLTGGGGTITANLAGTVTTVTTLTGHTPQTGDAFARLGAPVGASISADLQTIDGIVDAILVDTADMQPKLGTPAGASMSVDIAAIKTQTAAIETDTQDIQSRLPAALTAGGNIKADIEEINGVTITGDGSGTPFDVA